MSKKAGGSMAFYHEKGFVPAFKQASKFAGKDGHIGTMPDAIAMRLVTPPYKELGMTNSSNPTPWDRYYTTLTAEYFGVLAGRTSIIVAHGIGPMSTLQGILDAYRYEFDDKSRNHRGGRISQVEFDKLARGEYGDVSIIDYEEYRNRWGDQQFRAPTGYRRASDASRDALLVARLGPQAHEYITRHAALARQYYQKQASKEVGDPHIIDVEEPGNLPYWCRDIEPGLAFAHLTSIGGIGLIHHQNGMQLPSWACDVGIHEWWNGVRLLGVRPGPVGKVQDGPDARRLLRKHWQELFEPSGLDRTPDGLFVLMQMPDKTWFTQFQKKGASADSYEPEFRVTSMEKVGELARFYTESNYPVPIFRYDIREAQTVLPKEANAYELVGDPTKTGGADSQETCLVQGYRIEIDHTQRLIRQDALANDYDRMMQLM
ncbi:MAG: hypothetical protein HYT93_03100 [Parcubacteria group bacterium]|nr:hypothetical protein [Parcubacteria group bacterium]